MGVRTTAEKVSTVVRIVQTVSTTYWRVVDVLRRIARKASMSATVCARHTLSTPKREDPAHAEPGLERGLGLEKGWRVYNQIYLGKIDRLTKPSPNADISSIMSVLR